MTIKDAKNLKHGDKVKQKMHGYILTVEKIEEFYPCNNSGEYVIITCITKNGEVMKHNHKEVLKI